MVLERFLVYGCIDDLMALSFAKELSPRHP